MLKLRKLSETFNKMEKFSVKRSEALPEREHEIGLKRHYSTIWTFRRKISSDASDSNQHILLDATK